MEEAGAAWAADLHDLLELAKALAVRRGPARGRPGKPSTTLRKGSDPFGRRIAVLTCSGGDSALAADECARIGLTLPLFSLETAARLRDLLPDAATVGNPLDYTALIWGDTERLRDIVVAVGEDPSIDRILVFYDQAADSGRGGSWAAVRRGIAQGAAASATPVMVSSTLPELLDEASALEFMDAGVPAVAGLRTGLACAAALGKAPADATHLRAIAAAARGVRPSTNGRRWLAEHEAKELLRSAGLPAVEGRLVESEDDAVVALSELGGHVAVKLSAASVQHKADMGALELGVSTEEAVRAAYRRLTLLGVEPAGILVERMAPAGVELLVSARSDAVVPCLVIALGGAWTELLDDCAIVPLPASPELVEEAIRGLRAAPVLTGGARWRAGGRGRGGADGGGRGGAAPREPARAARAESGPRARARCDGCGCGRGRMRAG